MVKNDEMPGEDADVPPLTPEEKRTVEAWVLAGAPHELPAGFSTATRSAGKEARTEDFTFLGADELAGKIPSCLHSFPVALLMAAVLAEALAWWLKREEWMLLVRFLVILGAVASVPTVVLGWMAEFPLLPGSELATIYRFHQILGTATSAWALSARRS